MATETEKSWWYDLPPCPACGEYPEHVHIYAGEELVICPTNSCRAVRGEGATLISAIAAYLLAVNDWED